MRVQFDEWVFDQEGRQLLGASGAVGLSPKAFELLGALIERRPAAVSKAELKDRLWPSTYVADTNLPSLIAEIRSALSDDARRPRFVRTVQRYGYAFSAPARALDANRASSEMDAPFILVGGPWEIRLPEGETVLGRSRGAGGFIDSPSVSRHHARIVVADGRASIEDLGSKNGTFVNERPIVGPTELRVGDEVRLGRVARLVFRPAEEPSTATGSGRLEG